MWLGNWNDAWYLILCPFVKVIHLLWFLVFCGGLLLLVFVGLSYCFVPQLGLTSLIWCLAWGTDAISGGCCWLTELQNDDRAISYVIVIGPLPRRTLMAALLFIRRQPWFWILAFSIVRIDVAYLYFLHSIKCPGDPLFKLCPPHVGFSPL